MANRIMLNETSYHGSGAINEIATEAKAHGFKKAFVCSAPGHGCVLCGKMDAFFRRQGPDSRR